jgi:hypothetical protein
MTYKIPRAKKNLHQCDYHLNLMRESRNLEEVEINFASFVTSARSVTFVLQKEFSENADFTRWYGDKDNPAKGTKIYEMREDPLCKFFLNLRNSIEKEGISGIKGLSMRIEEPFNSATDIVNKPEGRQSLFIGSGGMFINVYPDTPRADLIPIITKTKISIIFTLEGVPSTHLGENIEKCNFFEICQMYYNYLKKLVEDCTATINKD